MLGIKNSSYRNTILNIPIRDVSPSEQIVYEAMHLTESEININLIDDMTIWLTDQNNTPLNLKNEPFTITGEIVIYD